MDYRYTAIFFSRGSAIFEKFVVSKGPSRECATFLCELLIYIDTAKAMTEGCAFFRSANNVILSPGFDGIIPCKYFAKVVDRHSGNVIFHNEHMEMEIEPSPVTSVHDSSRFSPAQSIQIQSQTQQKMQQSNSKNQRKAKWENAKAKSLSNSTYTLFPPNF